MSLTFFSDFSLWHCALSIIRKSLVQLICGLVRIYLSVIIGYLIKRTPTGREMLRVPTYFGKCRDSQLFSPWPWGLQYYIAHE